jgi:hypothetical protein
VQGEYRDDRERARANSAADGTNNVTSQKTADIPIPHARSVYRVSRLCEHCCGRWKPSRVSGGPRQVNDLIFWSWLAKLRGMRIAADVFQTASMYPPLVLTGGPAVGKSTTANLFARRRPRAAVVDVDDVRQLVVSGAAAPWDGAEGLPSSV